MITLYSTNCPKCKIIEQKLEQYSIPYLKINNVDEMVELGLEEVPVIKDSSGEFFDFIAANQLLNEKGHEAFVEV